MEIRIKIEIDDEMIKAINHHFGETKQTKSSLEGFLTGIIDSELQIIYSEYQDDKQD